MTTNETNALHEQGRQTMSGSSDRTNYVLARQRSRSRDRRESRLFLVDGQLFWNDDEFSNSGKRHSSVGFMFGSSMDLSGIGHSIDSSGGAGSGSDEAISYRMKWCRENIAKLKQQPWPMGKKLQMLKASKLFIKQHQGELRQGKQAKDVIAGTSDLFERYWRHFKREFANFLVIITPWEMRIKKIESHFGSVVASYFTFLRWIFWVNLANSLVMVAFVMVPELIDSDPDLTGMRRGPLGMKQPLGPNGKLLPRPDFDPTLGDLWEFEGFLRFSPIFQGYYSNVELSPGGFWRKQLAYLISTMIIYLFCFFCIARKLSQNAKLSRIGTKDDEYTFCWSVFAGWDFMVGNSETAYNKTSSLTMILKEGILEEKEQSKDRNWRLLSVRILANVLTTILIGASAYVVTVAVQRSETYGDDASFLQKQELQAVMSGIQFLFPPLFDLIGNMERYHPRIALRWQLGRILSLDFLNFYTLMFSLFDAVDKKGKELNEVAGNITLLRKNATYYAGLFTTTTTTTTTTSTTTTMPPLVVTLLTTIASNIITEQSGNSSTPIFVNGSSPIVVSNATNVATAQLNASTILTSVLLLASTTLAPSINTTAIEHAESSTSLAINKTATTTMLSSALSTTFAPSSASLEPSLVTMNSLPSSTTETTPATPMTSTVSDDSGDYPDLDQELKVVTSAKPKGQRVAKREVGRVKLKVKQGRVRRKSRRELAGEYGNEEYDDADDDDEEPLEGRLRLKPKQPTTSRHSTTMASVAGSGTRPRRPANGLAGGPSTGFGAPRQAPYGGSGAVGNRVFHSTTTSQAPLILDDDVNEDLYERARSYLPPLRSWQNQARKSATTRAPVTNDQAPINGYEFGPEPTTLSPKISDPLGIDYSVISSGSSTTTELADVNQSGGPTRLKEQEQRPSFGGQPFDVRAKLPVVPSLGINEVGPLEAASGDRLAASGDILRNSIADNPTSSSSTIPASNIAGSSYSTESSYSADGFQQQQQLTSCIPLEATVSTPIIMVSTILPNGTSAMVPLISQQKISRIGFNLSELDYTDCIEIPDFRHEEILALNESMKEKMQSLCWETSFGQEMVKAVIMDLLMNVVAAVVTEFLRAAFVRYCNRCFCWDLERRLPSYPDFKLAENVLHLVNNQSQVWMGMFFAPGLPAINTVKLAALMYIRSWAVMTSNIPHETVFKVSKSNNFYYWILLINLLICILPVAYSVTWIRPSWHCGPFGGECRMYLVVVKLIKSMLPPEANSALKYLTSSGAVIPILIALILIIYYLASTLSSSKEANKELKSQLKREKEQESALPEITSTAVVDSSAATGTTSAAVAASSTTQAAAGQANSASLAATNTLPVTQSIGATTKTVSPNTLMAKETARNSESRTKSLLMPPPI